MKCKLVFEDWRMVGIVGSVYNSPEGMNLSTSDLHSGTTFDCEIKLDKDTEESIIKAFKKQKMYPVFSVIVE